MSIRALFREFAIGKVMREDAHDRDVTLAWMLEGLRRTKRLPNLKSLLAKREAAGPTGQNAKQQRTMAQILSEAYKIPLRKKTKKKKR